MKCGFPSLQELTFNIIIKDFSRYSSAYSTTTNRDLKKSLLFLQRVYTQRVFSELVRTECLEKQHLDFVINEYLKKLDIGILFKLFEKEVVFDKVSKIGHSLVELSYNNYSQLNYMHAFKHLVPYFTNVTKMYIPLNCDDEILKVIAAFCSHISELYVQDSIAVTGVGLSAFYLSQNKCPLKILHINNTSVAWNDLKNLLGNMPTLQEVGYNNLPGALYCIHKEDIDNNSFKNIPKYNLTELDFTYYAESQNLASCLSMCSKFCPMVKKLLVPVTQTEELLLCSQFLALEDLSIRNQRHAESSVVLNDFLSVGGSKLKNLSITSCTLSMSTLIVHCSNLEVLLLKGNQYQQPDKCGRKTLPKLKSLRLVRAFSNNMHIKSISLLLNCSPNLRSLTFSYCNFSILQTRIALSNFFVNCCIKHVKFEHQNVGIDLLRLIVFYCKSLESLSLHYCKDISSSDVDMLKDIYRKKRF